MVKLVARKRVDGLELFKVKSRENDDYELYIGRAETVEDFEEETEQTLDPQTMSADYWEELVRVLRFQKVEV